MVLYKTLLSYGYKSYLDNGPTYRVCLSKIDLYKLFKTRKQFYTWAEESINNFEDVDKRTIRVSLLGIDYLNAKNKVVTIEEQDIEEWRYPESA